MTIQIYDNGNIQFAMIGKKLFRKLNFKKGHPAFIQVVQRKGNDSFLIVRRKPADTFQMQCCKVERTGNRKNPGMFFFTTPTLEYIKAVTGMEIYGRKILRIKELHITNNDLICFEICKQ